MKAGKKSPNRIYVTINQNFIIRVFENPNDNKLTTANKLSDFINDDELKIKLFNKVLDGKEYKYTFKIRNRLKIEFSSK